MNNNMLSTIPQVADLLRYKGYQQPQPIHFNKMDISIDSGQHGQDWEKFRQHALTNAYDSIKNIRQSKKDSLRSPYDNMPKKNYNVAAVPFGVTVTKNTVQDNGLKGGASLNSISDKDYDDYRQKLINRRMKEFEERDAQAPLTTIKLEPPSDFQQLLDKNDLIILSIEQRFINGVVDFYVYRDLLTLIGFYNRYIWVFDTAKPLLDLLNRLQDILEKATVIYRNKTVTKKTEYAKFFMDSIDRFINFIKEYISAIGNPPNVRQSIARALSRKYSSKDERVIMKQQEAKEPPEQAASAYQQAIAAASSAASPQYNPFDEFEGEGEGEGFIPTETPAGEGEVVEEYGNDEEQLGTEDIGQELARLNITKTRLTKMRGEEVKALATQLGLKITNQYNVPYSVEDVRSMLKQYVADERSNQGRFYQGRQ